MTASVTSTEAHEGTVTSSFWGLTLGSIGVVFGDIGTSPLYAFREAVAGAAGHGRSEGLAGRSPGPGPGRGRSRPSKVTTRSRTGPGQQEQSSGTFPLTVVWYRVP